LPRTFFGWPMPHRREGVAMHEAQADRQIVEAGVVLADLEAGFGEIDIDDMRRASPGGSDADAAGIGEQVEQ
jgi:hypothetical protein